MKWLGALGAIVVVATFAWRCDLSGDCSCLGPMLIIESPANDIVSAEGCGRSTSCSPPCGELWLPAPIDGGVCVATITFADGAAEPITTDWGRPHDDKSCCGPSYDFMGGVVIVHGDAGSRDGQ